MNPDHSEDHWIEVWKNKRRSDVPELPSDFTERVLDKLDSPPSFSNSPGRPALHFRFVRLALFVVGTVFILGRLVMTAAVFFVSTKGN